MHRLGHRARALGAALALFSACNRDATSDPATHDRGTTAPTLDAMPRSSATSIHQTDVETATHRTDAESELDRHAIRFAYVRGRQAEGADDARFHVRREDGVLAASSPERGVRGRFRADGVEVVSERARGRLRTRSFRCDDVVTTADETSFEGARAPHRAERRVTSGALAVTEWIESGPLGLEHGFDVDGRCDALAIAIEVEGLAVERSGEHVKLGSEAGVLHYAELFAVDADQRALPARFVVADARITLEVDTSSARWPVTVDPLLYVEDQRVGPPVGLGTDGRRGDWFGYSVAVHGDVALVGAYRDVIGGGGQGSVYVVERSSDVWRLQAKLIASDRAIGDFFGLSVALSGDVALIGAPRSTAHGAAYVFERVGSSWIEQAKLTPSDGGAFDEFGAAVAIDADTVLVGAPQDDDVASDAGAVYAFVRSGARWEQRQKITVETVGASHRFGGSVALEDDTAIVGAIEGRGGAPGPGSAYVLRHADARWTLQSHLRASDASVRGFGWSVDVSLDAVIVGAPSAGAGAAYVFRRSGDRWMEEAVLASSDGTSGDRLGSSVSLHGQTALVGAERHGGVAANAGAAYVFVRSRTWRQDATLQPTEDDANASFGAAVALFNGAAWVGAPFDEGGVGSATVFQRSAAGWSRSGIIASELELAAHFGSSVVVEGNTALIGAPAGMQGQVHVFVRSGASWTWQAMLSAPEVGNTFGASLALHGDTALVGFQEDTRRGPSTGSAYVFVREAGVWSLQAKLAAADSAANDRFGFSVALHGDSAMVGAHVHGGWPNGGAIYVFTRSGRTWSETAKLTRSDCPGLGYSLAFDGSTVVSSAPYHDRDSTFTGHLCTFTRVGGTWAHQSTTLLDTPPPFSSFGTRLAFDGDTLLVSAPVENWYRGAVYVLTRSSERWVEQAKLEASDGVGFGMFGHDVALSGNVAVIGAPHDDEMGIRSGAFYVFVRSSAGEWTQRLRRTRVGGEDELGFSVSTDGTFILAGAPRADGLAPFGNHEEGAAYFGRLLSSVGAECDVDASCTSGFCVDGVCCDTPCGGGSTDDCEACSVAAGAAADGLCAPTTGNACDDEVSCTESDTCDVGVCSGTVVCAPCPAGTWSEDGSDRTSCRPCDAGTWSVAGATACVAWTACSPGSFLASSGSATNDATCASCSLGTFSTTSNALACAPWSDCGEGRFETMAATTTSDRVCASCSRCRRDELEASPCTATRDTVCVGRDAGVGLDGGSSDAGALDAGAASDGGLLDGAIVATDAGDASMDAEADAASEGGVSGGGGCGGCTTGATRRAPSFGMLFLFGWVAARLTRRRGHGAVAALAFSRWTRDARRRADSR